MMRDDLRSVVELLRFRAQVQKEAPAYRFLEDGEREGASLTYGALDRRSRALAARLQQTHVPGTRALLVYPSGLEFIAAFFGCLYAGLVAVPAYPPHPARPGRALPRLRAIAADAGVGVILSTEALAALAPALGAGAPELARTPWLATDRVALEGADAWEEPSLDPDSLAFLQYTSGSTALPKGVMVTHGNLLHNLAYIHACAEHDADAVSVSWLPLYHDMGLIEGVLEPVFGGYPAHLMAPPAFLQRPLRWLAAISRYRATTSGGPNFAYELCVRKTTPAEREALDLSAWRVAYNGAEPVRRDTLERFFTAFAPCGFRWQAFYPVYGLAEATLAVSSDRQLDAPLFRTVDAAALAADRVREPVSPASSAVTLVACGRPAGGTRIVIAHPDTRTARAPDEVGEIWISGPSVTRGYWNRPEETERVFGARLADTGEGPFLRTGDLGFLWRSRLLVTGRLKDVIIVRGRKHYPQDIELTVERSHPAIRPGCAAAVSVPGPGGEGVVIVAEVDPRRVPQSGDGGEDGSSVPPHGVSRVIEAIREAVAEQHELQVTAVALVAPGGVPKTSSGKLQRHACGAAFLAGSLEMVARWGRTAPPAGAVTPGRGSA